MNQTGDPFLPSPHHRRWQLFFGMAAMMAISSPQYAWALFTNDLMHALHATLPEIQVTFAVLIVVQTFLAPFQGWLIDKFGPRLLLSAGATATALSWILAATVNSVWGLYLTYGLMGGIGTGIIYIGVIGLMVQWFPERRGFAVGMVAAGYGFGAILTTFAIADSLRSVGLASTLTTFGIILGIVGLLASLGMRRPDEAEAVALSAVEDKRHARRRHYAPSDMLKKPVFWLLFGMMAMMSTSGLMVISQMGAFAQDFGVHQTTVFGMAALPLALTIDRITNGLTRPLFGWISDRIGRERTMLLAFSLEGTAMTLWLMSGDSPVLFVLLSGVVFFGWGEIFSLFPAILTDTFGTRHATTNYGFLYMAQGVGSILGGPLAAILHQSTGSWTPVFAIVIVMDFATAFSAILLLKPWRKKILLSEKSERCTLRIHKRSDAPVMPSSSQC